MLDQVRSVSGTSGGLRVRRAGEAREPAVYSAKEGSGEEGSPEPQEAGKRACVWWGGRDQIYVSVKTPPASHKHRLHRLSTSHLVLSFLNEPACVREDDGLFNFLALTTNSQIIYFLSSSTRKSFPRFTYALFTVVSPAPRTKSEIC